MKNPPQRKQPEPVEIQSLLNLYNAGQLARAETAAQSLIARYPDFLLLHNVLGSALAGQGKFDEATSTFKKLIARDPNSAELHNNLGLVYQQQGKFEEAVESYRKGLALKPAFAELHYNLGIVLTSLGRLVEAVASYRRAISINPRLAVAHFNLGTALQELHRFDEAIASYREAIALEPGFVEAHGNLGSALQKLGRLEEAVASYRRALAIRPDPRGHFNLGTAFRDKGLLDDAAASYRAALAMKPDYAEAHNNLGEVLRDQGMLDAAIASYRRAIGIEPDNAEANYNVGVLSSDLGNFDDAIPYFERSELRDWNERVLYCLYKTERYEEFKERLAPFLAVKNSSPMIATLSGHYAVNFGVPDEYNFCRAPLDFVYQNRIDALAPGGPLLGELLRDINLAEIDSRKQGRLHYGIQSAGNLFKRPEESFSKLSALIRKEVEIYRRRFSAEGCVFITEFPADVRFSSSWYVKMRRGGHLTSHIHETGWVSGAVYLSVPQSKGGNEGSIELSTHGDKYPQRHADFPTRTVALQVGDIVMFPSSLFHRTIPFDSDEERICVAFDVEPAPA